jgi:hypothetical protein
MAYETKSATRAPRSERWTEGIKNLARSRGDGDAVWRRAVDITRELNIAPWIALAVAERLVALKEAPLLDQAARCVELQSAILEKRKRIGELKTTLPYAPYLLAVELVALLGKNDWELRKVTNVVKSMLNREQKQDERGAPMPVRTRSLDEYVAAVRRVRRLVEETGCSLAMALDVDAGNLSEDYVHQYVRQRRKLVRDELRERTPRATGYGSAGPGRTRTRSFPIRAPARAPGSVPHETQSAEAGHARASGS